MNAFNNAFRNVGKAISKIDWAKAGKEIAKVLSKIDYSKLAWFGIIGSAGVVIGALSRQPEINKLKNSNDKVVASNEQLRYKVKSLNHDTAVLRKRLYALKAYQFAGKAKESAELKGCIKFQYATKEYVEALERSLRSDYASDEDDCFIAIFEKILSGDKFTEEMANVIESRVIPKYKDEIDNLIEYDCMPLISQLQGA